MVDKSLTTGIDLKEYQLWQLCDKINKGENTN